MKKNVSDIFAKNYGIESAIISENAYKIQELTFDMRIDEQNFQIYLSIEQLKKVIEIAEKI